VTRGPQQQRLRDFLETAQQGDLRGSSREWSEGENVLRMISQELERMSGDMGRSHDEEFQGRTADAARTSFMVSAHAMSDKADQLKQGAAAFERSAAALDTAIAERDALARGDGKQPPERPNTPPGSTETADLRAQRDYDTAKAEYWEQYHADERRATDAMTALDDEHNAAAEVFKSIHGEPDPVPPPTGGGGGGAGGGGGGVPPVAGGGAGGGGGHGTWVPNDDQVWEPNADETGDTGGDTGGDDTGGDPTGVPTPTGDPTPGDPTGPSGPLGPTPSTTPVSTPTATPGGLSTPAAGGGVAAGLGVGVAGGIAGGVAGGLAFPGTVAGTGGVTSGGRGIGAGGPRGAGSSVLGRGNGVAGVGNGAGTGTRGSGRSAGRAGAGGQATGRGAGRGGTRGAAGSRGAAGAAGGAGRGSGRGKDKKVRGAEHDLFDDGQDWIDDEGVYDGVID